VADDERPAVGTVAEEAARLLDALGGWASTTQAGYAARTTPSPAPPDEGAPEAPGSGDSSSTENASASHADGHASRCESCGAENGVGQAVTCQLCPVCQGIGLLRSVRPETVDRLADLAGALAATLRDMAGQRRADAGDPPTKKSSHQSSRTRVQDIVVDDEDEHPGTAGSATS
jgi:hypothetical protein